MLLDFAIPAGLTIVSDTVTRDRRLKLPDLDTADVFGASPSVALLQWAKKREGLCVMGIYYLQGVDLI